MRTEPRTGHDGAFIDPEDLERAARSMTVANGGVKAAAATLRWGLRLRRLRDVAVMLIVLATVALWFGFVGHGIAWLFDHTLGIPLRAGWELWPL